ncbi:cell division protein FtsZ [Erythrobacter litoralis]|uniref:Cell division protein FtsZ n=1 Tax=Erythrobacter litoralis (strain HTCC2594) TaxID=314225 RepID=Q2NCY4_ERYLH|nr:cell division protein FtsZ [Erythrobacter litoralis]ABC62457.1 cell division protein [Erythrobacter litoralis HTCC2594]
MSINIGPATSDELRPRITVIGVGGAGGNAIANMIDAGIEGVDFCVANTDAQALNTSDAATRIQLGPDITGGLGAGARPEVGKAAAEETVAELEDVLDGVNMCFIAAGMGGGTGTGAAPVIAEAARRKGVLTVGVVTKPFLFEGTRRMRAAEAGIDELQKHVDTLIVIPNQNLFLVAKADTTFKEAFQLADEVLQQGVRSITDLMVMPGLINLDFADVKSVMEEMGKAMMGTGEGEGENRALEAAERAIANPLLDGVSMTGAKGVIISIIGGDDMRLLEVDEAANHIRELVDEDANIIWGSAFNPDLDGKIRVSVVATGIEAGEAGSVGTSSTMSLAGGRAPKRPVLELPEDDEADEDAFELTEPEMAEEPEAEPEAEPAMLGGLSGMDSAYDDEDEDDEDDDVDGIVDPLAGLRNDQDEEYEPMPEAASDDSQFAGTATSEEGYASTDSDEVDPEDDWGDALDLTEEEPAADASNADADEGDVGGGGQGDKLLLDADQLAERDEPVESAAQGGKRRGLVAGSGGSADGGSGDGGGGGGDAGGSTLFERMANLSRGSGSKDKPDSDDDDDEDGGALNIPRFLGRQNNQ